MSGAAIEIIGFKPEYAFYFEQFNKAWIEEYYTLEPVDEYVLSNPEEAILKPGGIILFARHEDRIIGAVALKLAEPGVYELTKMAVDKSAQGLGAGKLLCAAAIDAAKDLGARQVILYSQTKLQTAIIIYRKLGFTELPLEAGKYKRADIKMGIMLKEDAVD